MGERTTGARAALSNASVYAKFADLVSGPGRPNFVRENIRARSGDRILDIGCGPGTVFGLLPDGVDYVGFDVSPKYIESAEERHGDRAEFHCLDVQDADLPANSFDIVVVMGVLHHLEDDRATALLDLASRVLVDGGRAVMLEAVFIENQPRLAKWVVSRDRGTSIRHPDGYTDLAEPFFDSVTHSIRHDLIRIPYTHIILECEGPVRSAAPA